MFSKKRRFRSSEKQKEKTQTLQVRALLSLGVALALFLNLSLFSLLPQFQITNVRIEGVEFLEKDEIKNVGESYLNKKYITLRASHIFFYPYKRLKQELLSSYSEIQDLSVKQERFHTLVIRIQEYEPFVLWCGEGVADQDEKQCHFVSKEGIVFSKAPYFSDGVYLELYGPLQGVQVREGTFYREPLGTFTLPPEIFRQLIALFTVFDAMKLPSKEFVYKNDSDAELILTNSSRIKFTLTQNFETLLGDLDALFESQEVTKEDLINPEGGVEYIDFRFDNRVFYK